MWHTNLITGLPAISSPACFLSKRGIRSRNAGNGIIVHPGTHAHDWTSVTLPAYAL